MAKQPLEFIKFSLVGAVNTLIDFTVFTVLSNMGVLLLVAQCVSYTCGVLNSFLLNRTWTFRGRGQYSGQWIRFLVLNLGTLTITYGILVYLHDYLVWPILVSKLLATGVSLVINFMGSRVLVFS
ncbi:GtrA family protein [Desulfosporosinus sp. OT]|uniref:GtrA family protein n=1 Tax=Desulfosporosinus sp. OT TaxID=913865 RepID=UPI00058B8ADC|nr:GtrA family protein [Desulfosporosinus sp. OT]